MKMKTIHVIYQRLGKIIFVRGRIPRGHKHTVGISYTYLCQRVGHELVITHIMIREMHILIHVQAPVEGYKINHVSVEQT